MIWVASIRWVIQRGCLAALLMKMLFGEQRGMPVSRPFLAVLASCTWLLALGTRHRTRSGPKTVASTAKGQRQLQTTEEAAVLNKNHADVGCLLVCVCVFVCGCVRKIRAPKWKYMCPVHIYAGMCVLAVAIIFSPLLLPSARFSTLFIWLFL